jgi:hypothetical protein
MSKFPDMKYLFSALLIFIFATVNAQFISADSVPVRISSISAEKTTGGNKINWQVSCSLPFAGFDVQRSYDGVRYATIHSFQADELRCRQPFDYTDQPGAEKSFYRIKVGDIDGRIYSSKIVTIYGQTQGFDINSISPSVILQNTMVTLSASSQDKAQIFITSLQGIVVLKKEITLLKGNNYINLELGHFPKGNFNLSVINSKGVIKSGSILKM